MERLGQVSSLAWGCWELSVEKDSEAALGSGEVQAVINYHVGPTGGGAREMTVHPNDTSAREKNPTEKLRTVVLRKSFVVLRKLFVVLRMSFVVLSFRFQMCKIKRVTIVPSWGHGEY